MILLGIWTIGCLKERRYYLQWQYFIADRGIASATDNHHGAPAKTAAIGVVHRFADRAELIVVADQWHQC
jgi:hypothetical protein